MDGMSPRLRILVVDSYVDAAESLRMMLDMMGYEVEFAASTGHQAIAVAARWHPDLVVLDLGLPDLAGRTRR